MKKKILLVDDEETLRWALHEALTDEGYEVENTSDGVKAVEFAKKTGYDLVISDLRMPTMSGIQLITEIKKVHPDIKAIIMTAYGSVEAVVEAMRIGVSDFVAKPFKIEYIKNVIQRVLDQSRKGAPADEAATGVESRIGYADFGKQKDAYFVASDPKCPARAFFSDYTEGEGLKAFLFGFIPNEKEAKDVGIMAKTMFRYLFKMGNSPAVILKEFNDHLCKNVMRRFPLSLFCAIYQDQRQSLCYSIYGKELTCFLRLPNADVNVLESYPFSLNLFPGMTIMENTASVVTGSKLVLVCNGVLSNGLRNGTIPMSGVKDAMVCDDPSNCIDMANKIKMRLDGICISNPKEKAGVVMVSNLACGTNPLWVDTVSITTPIQDYQKIIEQFETKLSVIMENDVKRYEIITSMNEAVLNATAFAYSKGTQGVVLVKLSKLGDEIIIEVCDQGCGFDGQIYGDPDVTACKDVSKKSGRGIFLMRQIMDRVMIQSSKEAGTIVHLAKRVACNEN